MATPIFRQVLPGIYVGNMYAATTLFLSHHDITAIINLTGRPPVGLDNKPLKLSEHIDVFDFMLPNQELMDTEIPKTCAKLDDIMNDIRSLRVNNRNILVICNDGRNKSLLVLGYYLIVDHGCPYGMAISTLEALYFTEQQRADAKDFPQGDPSAIEHALSALPPDHRSRLEALRAGRREVMGLTMMTFRKLLRIKGGAKK